MVSAVSRLLLVLAMVGFDASSAGAGSSTAVQAASADACAAWRDEISPLPTTDDPDPFTSRWAKLRFAELSKLASRIAATDPSAAYRLWKHAGCIAPREAVVEQQLARLVPGREALRAPGPVLSLADEQREESQLSAIDAALTDTSTALEQARFREALSVASYARQLLGSMTASAGVRQRQARLEVMTGTAELALDREDEAALSLRRALHADPGLDLDDTVAPKVRRLLFAVRASTRQAAPQP
jgi:hypothetical protein